MSVQLKVAWCLACAPSSQAVAAVSSTVEVYGHVWQQALLPSFLEILARDYVSWAKGERRTTGHLAPKALRDSVEPAS